MPQTKGVSFMRQKGFSLVELLIVVAIIAIIVAIAVPNLLTSRQAAQSAAAAGDLRTINSAEIAYVAGAGNGNFGLPSAGLYPNYISFNTDTYIRSGYTGTVALTGGGTGYSVTSFPTTGAATTTALGYWSDETGTIRWVNTGSSITNAATPLGAK
jgi:type IV pilus assembly protein PilA